MSQARFRTVIRFGGLLVLVALGLGLWWLSQALRSLEGRGPRGKRPAASGAPSRTTSLLLPAAFSELDVLSRLLPDGAEVRARHDLTGDGLAELLVVATPELRSEPDVVKRALVLTRSDTGWKALLDTSAAACWSVDQRDTASLARALGLAPGEDPAPALAQLGRYRIESLSEHLLAIEPLLQARSMGKLLFTWDDWRMQFKPALAPLERTPSTSAGTERPSERDPS